MTRTNQGIITFQVSNLGSGWSGLGQTNALTSSVLNLLPNRQYTVELDLDVPAENRHAQIVISSGN